MPLPVIAMQTDDHPTAPRRPPAAASATAVRRWQLSAGSVAPRVSPLCAAPCCGQPRT